MKRSSVPLIAGLLCAVLISAARADDRYERYERVPPPRRGAGAPPPQHAVYGQSYFFAHLGLFEPNDDRDGLKGYDSGGAFDVGIGSRVSPVLAIEGAFGAYSAERGPDDISVVPLTIGARLIIPSNVIEPYLGGGLGLYFANLDEPSTMAQINDSDTTIGGYAALGVDAWLNPRMALNFEGKYHWVEPEFDGFDVDASGWTLSLGFRISF